MTCPKCGKGMHGRTTNVTSLQEFPYASFDNGILEPDQVQITNVPIWYCAECDVEFVSVQVTYRVKEMIAVMPRGHSYEYA